MEVTARPYWGHTICMYCGRALETPFDSRVHKEGTIAHLCFGCGGLVVHLATALIKVSGVATRARARRALTPDALDRELRRIAGTTT